MKTVILILLSIFFLSFLKEGFSQTPYFEWAERVGGINDDFASEIVLDRFGNIITVGYFLGSAIFGNDTLISAGNYDIFVTKYNNAGNQQWARKAGGLSGDYGRGITVDHIGNYILTGSFLGTAYFDTTALSSPGSENVFLAKMSPEGNFIWVKQASGTGRSLGKSISTDILGNYVITGHFWGTVTFGTTTLINPDISQEIFIAKYDSLGNFIWAKQVQTSHLSEGRAVATDRSGNIAITGLFQGTATFGTISLSSTGVYDIFVAKYNPSGNALWAKRAGASSNFNGGNSITVDTNDNIITTGYFSGRFANFGNHVLTSAGGSDAFIAKYDPLGNVLWAKRGGGINGDAGNAITIDKDNNVFASGSFQDTMSFNTHNPLLHSTGGRDIFVAKYDSLGHLIWAKQAGGNSDDIGKTVRVDSSGNCIVGGDFTTTALFDTISLTSLGNSDIFITKLISTVTSIKDYKNYESVNGFELLQNYPNPFNPTTRIRYSISRRQFVKLKIYDLLGQEITTLVNEEKPAGAHTVEIDASRLSSGIYFYRLQAGDFVETKKMILMR